MKLRPLALALWLSALPVGAASGSQYPLDQATAIIPADHAHKLRKAGVKTTADFLTWGKTAEGRRLLAERARLSVDQITSWVRLADLMRIRGIGPDVARLLTAVGVRSIADLRKADAEAIANAIRDTNNKQHLSTNPPGAESIRYWVEQSQALPILVSLD
jgi:predicted flap endonuclease-1-like 5' DNA nuclease